MRAISVRCRVIHLVRNGIYREFKAIIHRNKFSFTGVSAIRSRSAQITVLVPPENPKIVKGNTSIDEIVATEDREIELECISSGGKPAAEVRNLM